MDTESIQAANVAYGDAVRAIIHQKPYADLLKTAVSSLAEGKRHENDAVHALRMSLIDDLHHMADSASLQVSHHQSRLVDIGKVYPPAQPNLAILLESLSCKAVYGTSCDISLSDVEDIATVWSDKPEGAFPTLCPSVSYPDHFVSSALANEYGGYLHGGHLWRRARDGNLREMAVYCGRIHRSYALFSVFGVYTDIGVFILPKTTLDSGRNFADLSGDSVKVDKDYFMAFRKDTQQGRFLGCATNPPRNNHIHVSSVCRTKQIASFTGRTCNPQFNSAYCFDPLVRAQSLPQNMFGETSPNESVIDRYNPLDPFCAYYAPSISYEMNDLVVFSSPYLKIISAGPDAGPAIVHSISGRYHLNSMGLNPQRAYKIGFELHFI